MMACGDISAGVSYNCDNPLQGGADATLYLINSGQLDAVVQDVTDPNIITALTLSVGALSYAFQGFKRSLAPTWEAVNTDAGQTVYRHSVQFFLFDISQATKNVIQDLALGSYVGIIQNNTRDEHAFEVLGLGAGLEMQPGSLRAVNENNGVYTILLGTPENEFEGKLPRTLYDGTSYASTKTYVEGLLTP